MAVGLSLLAANGLLDELLGGNIWVQLHTGDPGVAGTSNVADEYTRKQASFLASSSGETETDTDLVWLDVAASETYRYLSIWSDAMGGDFYCSGALDDDAVVNEGDTFKVEAGDAVSTLGPVAS